MIYAQFKVEWSGRRVEYDHVFIFQCVDLILEYCREVCNLPNGIWGNAIDYANNPTNTFKANFERVYSNYQPGDIVVLKGLVGNPFGHIGLFDRETEEGVWLLEQNATGSGDGLGRSAIGVWRAIPISRIVAVWRYKGVTPSVPKPAPARSTVFLPSGAGPWHFYYIGSSYNPNDVRAVKGILRPDLFPPGLTYKNEGYVAGGAACVITTHDYGRGVIWLKGTLAQVK